VDIAGAYLNAYMKQEVFFRLDPEVSKILIDMDLDYK
jgi:hypothetical protein